ncbi:MAG: CBS domain-containing protein [Actinomycetota bacterium]|nr:CBS domain-containing protein [Actinomycetota bacterium]
MTQTVNDVMTGDPRTVAPGDTIAEAARAMRESDAGDVLVVDQGRLSGIVTDRDIAIRAVADGRDPNETPVSEVCTTDVHTLTPDQSVDDAIRLMREHNVRRIPVVQDGRPAGVVSLGDLAIERDERSALAEISAAPPDH